jgi:hypothetical protein
VPNNVPIACTLTADEMPRRLTEMSAVGRSSLVGVDTDGEAPVLRFRPSAETRQRLEAIVAAESHCCSFLHFELRQETDALALTITGPALAQPLVADLVDAFRAEAAQ